MAINFKLSDKMNFKNIKISNLYSKRIWKILIFLLIILFIWRVVDDKKNIPQPKEKISKVSLLNLAEYQEQNNIINAIGKVESVDQVEIKSQLSSEIQKINVEIGDQVKKGDLLVELDHGDLDAQLSQSQASILRARGSLNQRIAGATDEAKAQAQKAVDNAQVALEQTKTNGEISIKNAEIALETAKTSLDNTRDTNKQSITDAYNNLRIISISNLSVIHTALTLIGNILGEEPGESSYDDDFSDVLGVKDMSTKYNAESYFDTAKNNYEEIKSEIDNLNISSSQSTIKKASDFITESLTSTLKALREMRKTLDNTITKSIFTSSNLDALKASVDAQITAINTAKSNQESGEQAAKTSKLSDNTNDDSVRLAYEKAVEDLESAKKQSEVNIKSAEANLAIQNANLVATLADPREVDLSSMRASVRESQAAYSLAKTNRDKAFIHAPFDGVVSAVPFREFDLVSAGQNLVGLVNANGLEIKAYINEKDRKLVDLGSKVEIEGEFSGEITRISPSIDNTTHKIEIIISVLDEETYLTIGQFTNLKIKVSDELSKKDIFLLPLKAVKISSEAAYVFVVNEEAIIESQEVQLGDVVNDLIEIVSGLDANMEVLESTRGLEVGDKVLLE